MLHRLLAAAMIALCFWAHADESILWWLIEDDGSTVVDWYGTPSTITETGATDARLRVEDANGTVAYLDFYVLNDANPPEYERWSPGSDGAAIPVWAFADVTGYTDPAYSFAVELGNWEYEAGWVKTLASSEIVPYNNMLDHIGVWNGREPDVTAPWMPSSYAVPEPSGGVLLLLGGAILALRRRRGGGG